MPTTMPGARTRRENFDRTVTAAVLHLSRHCPQIRGAAVVVEDVPWVPRRALTVPLGRVVRQASPAQLVLHRRPIECAGGGEDLVRDVLAELAADLLLASPEQIDPHYPRL
jgi:hypothetical protein